MSANEPVYDRSRPRPSLHVLYQYELLNSPGKSIIGGGSLLVPIMFAGINEKTYYVLGAALLIYIPIIYTFFPETAGQTLEEIHFLFASNSLFTWNEEKEFEKRKAAFEAQIQKTQDQQSGSYIEKRGSVIIENSSSEDSAM